MHNTTPCPFSATDPPLLVPEFASIGRERLPVTEFVRHQIGFGSTGSGKTESFVRPLTRAVLRYPEPSAMHGYRGGNTPEELRFAALVIDPKHELVSTVRRHADEFHQRRTYEFGPGKGYYVSLFEGEQVAAMPASQIAERILALSDYTERDAQSRDPFWGETAKLLFVELIEIDRWVEGHYAGGLAGFWCDFAERALNESLLSGPEAPAFDPASYVSCHHRLFTAASRYAGSRNSLLLTYCEFLKAAGLPSGMCANIETLSSLAENTATSLIVVFQSMIGTLLDPSLNECIWVNPHMHPPIAHTLRVADVIRDGDVIVYSPVAGLNETMADETIGRALKSLFFRMSLGNKPPRRGVAYIADEAQRFLTSGAKSSEAHFLDVGRAYRAGAVLATQSTASLIYRLSLQQGGEDRAHSVMNIILANCGTKFFFRSTEPSTNSTLTSLLPDPDHLNWPHICAIRGTASLRVGEAFFLRADGEWGRSQIKLRS